MTKGIYITEIDKERLMKLIDTNLHSGKMQDKSLQNLEDEMNKATIVNPRQISQNIITMNSRVLLCIDEEEMEISLVYPSEADWSAKKVSIFSPIGTAILGYAEGDIIEWKVPSGITKIYIKKILYQPEAAGDYHM